MRFATIGTSDICRRFIDALKQVDGASYELAYSRTPERAQAYAQEQGAERSCSSLEDLAADPDVDAVYIASPNALHTDQAKLMLSHGKHVFVEKSFAANARLAREVFDLAESQGLVAMEAMRNIHAPGFKKIAQVVSEDLGQVRAASFGFAKITSRIERLRAGERLNVFDPQMASGALMDMGVYTVEPTVALWGRPQRVTCYGVTTTVPGEEDGAPFSKIDLAGAALLDYGTHTVQLSYGKIADDLALCQVQGEGGTLSFRGISGPEDLHLHTHKSNKMVYKADSSLGDPIPVEVVENDMVYELQDFIAAAGEGAKGPLATRYRDITLGSLELQDEMRRQLGVSFPADE